MIGTALSGLYTERADFMQFDLLSKNDDLREKYSMLELLPLSDQNIKLTVTHDNFEKPFLIIIFFILSIWLFSSVNISRIAFLLGDKSAIK